MRLLVLLAAIAALIAILAKVRQARRRPGRNIQEHQSQQGQDHPKTQQQGSTVWQEQGQQRQGEEVLGSGRIESAPSPRERQPPAAFELGVRSGGSRRKRRRAAAHYANLWLVDAATRARLNRAAPIVPLSRLELHLSLDALDPRSQVSEPSPFPTKLLPNRDVVLDIVVASTHFLVGPDGRDTTRATLVLPADGGPARDPHGATELVVSVLAPPDVGPARLRVAYYFRDALLQSQVLNASIGKGPGFTIETDFTATANLRDVDTVSARHRLAILINQDMTGNHQLLLRSPDSSHGEARNVQLDHLQLKEPLDDLRHALESEESRPRQRDRSKRALIRDLKRLAPPGARLHTKLFVQAREVLAALVQATPDTVVHVSRPTTSQLTVPWAFLYEFPLPQDADVDQVRICHLVEQWDEDRDLIGPGERRCPYEKEAWHVDEPVLCPFGFWGFRYDSEVLTTSDGVNTAVLVAAGARVAALVTQKGVDEAEVEKHLDALSKCLNLLAQVDLEPVTTVAQAQTALRADIPLVYCYCHGVRPGGGDTVLSIGRGEALSPDRFTQWAKAWLRSTPIYWDKVRPLVFINACHSVEINPDTMLSYVEAFVGGGGASGVIGTEATVHADLAMEAANLFFDSLTTVADGRGGTVGEALERVRNRFLARGNMFGLLYTPYCWADLHLVAG